MLFFSCCILKLQTVAMTWKKVEPCRLILGGMAGGGGATAESSVANVVLCTNRWKRNDGVLMQQEVCGGAVDFCLFELNKVRK